MGVSFPLLPVLQLLSPGMTNSWTFDSSDKMSLRRSYSSLSRLGLGNRLEYWWYSQSAEAHGYFIGLCFVYHDLLFLVDKVFGYSTKSCSLLIRGPLIGYGMAFFTKKEKVWQSLLLECYNRVFVQRVPLYMTIQICFCFRHEITRMAKKGTAVELKWTLCKYDSTYLLSFWYHPQWRHS